MNKYKALNRKTLVEDYRILDVFYGGSEWFVTRTYKNKGGYDSFSTIHVSNKNGSNSINFTGENGKTVTIDLLRLVYVWFFDDLTEDDAVILVDGNKKNLAITNIKKVSREEAARMKARTKEEAEADGRENAERLKEIGVGVPVKRRIRKPKKGGKK